ncbi:hypothetical protein M0R04_07565 [Candidatus Dojkabacteria bacterium]|jgi:hypothetical protein|nr:hypothetical protein [Candidatus Dojkabacteria bacterium]
MIIDSNQPVIHFYKPPFGKIIGSENPHKIVKMIGRDYGWRSVHREVLSCPLWDFINTLEGVLHNSDWND